MDRCALFVDASYALADGAMAVHGTRRRDSVSWNHAGLLTLLAGLAKDRTGLPVLRCYWYETAPEGRRTQEQDALAEMPGLKLRLVNAQPGRREGIDTPLRRDLVTLAKNGAISDAFIASADEHLAEIVTEVQDLGLRVVILHISTDGGWTVPQPLRQECDDIVEISGVHLRPFVELIRGAEPAADEARPLAAIGPATPGAGELMAGVPQAHLHPLAMLAAPSPYPLPDPADPVAASAAQAGQHAHSGPIGPMAGGQLMAAAPQHSGPIGPVAAGQLMGAAPQHSGPIGPVAGQQGSPGVQPYPGVGQVPPASVGPAQAVAVGYPGPAQQQQSQGGYLGGASYGVPMNGSADAAPGPGQHGGQAQPIHNGMVLRSGPIVNGVPQGRGQNGVSAGYHAPAGSQSGGPRAVGAPPAGNYGGPGQPSGYQNGFAQPVAPALGAAQSGVYQVGPAQHGVSYQNGVAQNAGAPVSPFGPQRPGGMLPGAPAAGYEALPPPPRSRYGPGDQPGQVSDQGPYVQVPPMAGQPGLAQARTMPADAGYGAPVYPAPVSASALQPSHAQFAMPVFAPAPGAFPAPPQPAALMPARAVPAPVSLPEAVQAAHAEGFSFGEAVGRDAPGLWLDAVLARKPRVPSDLEARLLQGSALPIDSLLHDEVRHSLRRGFWDALESVRR